ncbi:Hypothetical predicted protein [Olea europaea subsp. europaea]|uniref:Uncharacterized protein n=1 Tax=Olea europaea subsp. europaea TaxID=158383 RepID=A0A8S0VFE2_OLEEU|nr:Hypothetical predicted protein [Olea europaea subsp. europaea]
MLTAIRDLSPPPDFRKTFLNSLMSLILYSPLMSLPEGYREGGQPVFATAVMILQIVSSLGFVPALLLDRLLR